MLFFSISTILFLRGGSGGHKPDLNRQTGSPGELMAEEWATKIHRKFVLRMMLFMQMEDVGGMYMCSWNDICFSVFGEFVAFGDCLYKHVIYLHMNGLVFQ